MTPANDFMENAGHSWKISRRALLLGTTSVLSMAAIGGTALSQNFSSQGPVHALRSMQSKLADSVSIKDYGAIGDGKSHPLSSIDRFNERPSTAWTLDEWRQIFPFATAVSNEIDGLAIQAAVNTGKAIRVPTGTFCCSLSITTDGAANAVILGDGKSQSEIRMITPGADGWRHGLSTAATGLFHATGVSFTTTAKGGAAINLNFASSKGVEIPIFVLDGVFFIGAANCGPTAYWEHPVWCNNLPRGLSFRDVTAFGLCNGVASSAAFQFDATTGSFGYQLVDVIASNYETAFAFNYNSDRGPLIEGVEMFNCQAYNGDSFVRAINKIVDYLAPQFNFISCGTELSGTVFKLRGLQDVVIENALIETNAASYADKPLIDFAGCTDVWVCRTHCNVNPSANHVVFSQCDGNCFDINYDLNSIINFGSIDYIYAWDRNPHANVVREFRTAFRGTGKITKTITNDEGGNQISEAWVNAYITSDVHAIVDFSGTYHLGAFASGRTDDNGEIKITFPTRPFTGLPLFLQVPHVVVTPENVLEPAIPMVTVVARTRTYFTLKFKGMGSGRVVSINYIAYGE